MVDSVVPKPQMNGKQIQLNKAVPISTDSTDPFRHPRPYPRVHCSLGGFGFLAFAFLVFLLEAIHVSSEEVGVCL